MAQIFITGSADGLGKAAAKTLLAEGHQVIVHARSRERLGAIDEMIKAGARYVLGDLASLAEMKNICAQVNQFGKMDAVIHNAGVYSGPSIIPVNVVAPYVLTTLISRPKKLIYLSSGMHFEGHAELDQIDWAGTRESASYSDSKLLVTTLALSIARLWPEVIASAVDPGWVPTKMGGPNAPDDLRLGHLTQEWLATSNNSEAMTSGGYWHHQKRITPHPSASDPAFQDKLLNKLHEATGVALS